MIRALIVDDEKMTRNGLVRHIKWEQLGVDEVQTAASSNEALQMLDTLHPDLVISDIRMPGMNGVELCQEIRRRQPHCQIIFLTAYSDKEYLKAAIEIGALGYVEKTGCSRRSGRRDHQSRKNDPAAAEYAGQKPAGTDLARQPVSSLPAHCAGTHDRSPQ